MSPYRLSKAALTVLVLSVAALMMVVAPASIDPVDALVALYDENAVFLPASGSRVTGTAAIRDLFEKALAVNTPDLQVHSKVTEQSAKFAYDSGEYEETITSGGGRRSGGGNYLVVLKPDRNRRWRIVAHMWTDAPTTPQ